MNRSTYYLKLGATITGIGTAIALFLGLSFLRVAEGISIRPMGAGVLLLFIMLITLMAGLGCLIRGWNEKPGWLRWYVLALSFSPFPIFHFALRLAQSIRGFTLAP